MMSALSRDVHCFWFCSTTQNQRLLKESIKIDAKIRENTPTCETSEHRQDRIIVSLIQVLDDLRRLEVLTLGGMLTPMKNCVCHKKSHQRDVTSGRVPAEFSSTAST